MASLVPSYGSDEDSSYTDSDDDVKTLTTSVSFYACAEYIHLLMLINGRGFLLGMQHIHATE